MNSIDRVKKQVLSEEGLLHLSNTLKGYKFVDELQNMREGTFVRWFHLGRRRLTNGAFLVRVDIRDDGIYLLFRNNFKKLFSVWADECLLFQKITAEEHIVLSAMNRVARRNI